MANSDMILCALISAYIILGTALRIAMCELSA